ncbi:phospholipase D-like domain-containing protein [Flavobacteriales bacterium]|nr:phospholipase D-like domain-containing protein [Flavobacteriales bacterium]
MKYISLLSLFIAAAVGSACAQDNILEARTNFNIGDVVTVSGVVTSDENLGSVRYLQDATAGIALYPGGDWSAWDGDPIIGDSLTVTGEITEYNGLLEIGPNLSAVTFHGLGTVPEAQIISASSMNEGLEGELVRVNGASFPLAGLEITGNSTYDFTAEGETGIIYVRSSNSLVGETLTGCAVDLVGVVSQFSFDGTGGYQLLPRGPQDLIPASDICYTSPVVQSNMSTTGFTLSWSTDLASTGTVEYGLTEDLGQVIEGAAGTTDHSVDLTGLEPGTIYYARATATLPDGGQALSSIRPYATVSNSSGDIHVYFNGTVDVSVALDEEAMSLGTDMNDTVAAWITSAQHTLDVAAYNFNDQTLEDAFEAAANNGVEIRWIYEGQNANVGLSNLPASVITHPRTDGQGSGMHNKFIVGDADYPESAFVLTGSTNLTTGNLVQDLNNAIVFEDQSLARAYTIEFNEMWGAEGMTPDAGNAKFGADKTWNTPVDFLVGGVPVELYFSPSDGTTNAIREEIEAADSEFEFAVLAFTRDDLGDAISALGQSFFVNPMGGIEQVNTTGSEYENLLANGVQVYHHNISNDLHHKYAIVDHASPANDPVVITGSHNWSSSAENVNDENTVIVHDARVANLYHQEFRGILIALGVIQSVEDQDGGSICTVYPNPARDILSVRWESDAAPGIMVIRDLSGREVMNAQLNPTTTQLSLSGVASGVYTASVNGQGLPTRIVVE